MQGMSIPAKTKRIFFYLTGVLLVYSLLGFLIIPAVLSSQIPGLIKQHIKREAHVGDIHFNPFSMELSVLNFELKNKDGSLFSSFEQLYVNVSVLQSISSLSVVIDTILLNQPYASIQRNKQGSFNFDDLIHSSVQKEQQHSEPTTIFPVRIAELTLSDGKLTWEDHHSAHAQREEIHPLNLKIKNFSTQTDQQSQLGFSLAVASGGQIQWHGDIQLNPLTSKGRITLEKIDFHRLWELFLQDSVNFKILSGSERIEADYQLSETPAGFQVLIDNAHINLFNLKLSEKRSDEVLVNIPEIQLKGIDINVLDQHLSVAVLSTAEAHFKTWLNAEGQLNLLALLMEPPGQTPSTQPPKTTVKKDQPWNIRIDQFKVKNYGLDFTDKTVPGLPHITLSAFNLNSEKLSSDLKVRVPFNLEFIVNDTGRIHIKGQAVPDPVSAKLQVIADKLAISDFQPYINQFVRLNIISGEISLNNQIEIVQPEEKPLAVRVQGISSVSNFVSRDPVSKKDFLNFEKLTLDKIDLDLAKKQYIIDTIVLQRPYSRILIRKDKTININDIAIPPATDNKPAVKQADKESETFFKIARIAIQKGVTDFSDQSLILPFSAHMTGLKGNITGISSVKNAVAKIVLSGKVDGLAPVSILGKFSPSKGDSDLKLDFRNMPLPLMTPYMAEFAGRKIEKGNMSLSLIYKLQNKRLTASNKLLIDQLELGDQVENPKAVSLPLDLAIALLEDSDGKIKLDVPITGSLEDPEFSVAGVVMDALVNVISKIITSPFNAIAALTGSDEDISKISFSAGKTSISESQQHKLDGIIAALKNRPGLSLEIKGIAFSETDWPPLQSEALRHRLLALKAEQLSHEKNGVVEPQHIILNDAEYRELLAEQFIKTFPELADRSLFGTPRLKKPDSGDFFEFAQAKLASDIPPDPLRLQKLAATRAKNIAKYLISHEIPADRIYLLDMDINPQITDKRVGAVLNLAVH